jgi:hypothetical protein
MSAVPVVLNQRACACSCRAADQRAFATASESSDRRTPKSADQRTLQLAVMMLHVVNAVRPVADTREAAWSE